MIIPGLRSRLYDVKAAAVSPLRRGSRTILSTPGHGLGFGNFLYFWLHAHIRQEAGDDCRVLETPAMAPWLDTYAGLRDTLTIHPSKVRLWDRREWEQGRLYQAFGEDYTRVQLRDFIKTYLLPAGSTHADPHTVTINIRRGDYYSVPEFRNRYGFNIPDYIRAALIRAEAHAPINEIRVVSDDIAWCRDSLGPILTAHCRAVEYAGPADTPQKNFHALATTSRLIGTNSTFSYWGGYVSNTLHGAASHVIAPRFHARDVNGGNAYQLDPVWHVIEDLPSGWDMPRASVE
jgi:hypothetical protein